MDPFSFFFQQFCLFCLYRKSYCHGTWDTQNRKRKQKTHEQATNPKYTQHAHSMAALQYAPEMLCQATAAGSGGRASKCGNGVKKQGAGRASPALMEERAKSASERMPEPRTSRKAGGRGATVAGDLVILGMLFNSWLGKQLWFWLPGPLEVPPAQPHLESFSNNGRKHWMHIHRDGKSEHNGVAFSQVPVGFFSGKNTWVSARALSENEYFRNFKHTCLT